MNKVNIQSYNTPTSQLKVNGRWRKKWRYSCRDIFRVKVDGKYYVIKVAPERGDAAGQQNLEEYKVYQKIPPKDRKYFAKVYDYGVVCSESNKKDIYSYLIQEYIYCNRNQNMDRRKFNTLDRLCILYNLDDIFGRTASEHLSEFTVGDLSKEGSKLYNVLLNREGKLKIIDWGCVQF